ncbi:MAG: hypothetical protein KDB18_08990 [Salinibacterium sp.]|nr:hypothetical protein [Salinibacterium sp.]
MIRLALGVLCAFGLCASPASAVDSRWLANWTSPAFINRVILDPARDTGWVTMRKEGADTWIYFTAMLYARCAIDYVRYSIDSTKVNQFFEVPACDPEFPSALPNSLALHEIGIKVGPPDVRTVSVQAVYVDGSRSDILTYAPCPNAGSRTCAQRIH